ncbi:MAG: YlxR family protein [Lachnospiraceae bacterium]|jgi:predicted RNA-binding protein YlxR (DUF448 family)|nr:YlxR family protein [Lachnospiraceae bacterium]
MEKSTPERSCTVCGARREKSVLLRIVCTKEGVIEIDPFAKKNGRGAYICRDKECLLRAKKKKALSRAFKREVPESVYDEIERFQ